MNRPDYIHCIERTHVHHRGMSWCGKPVSGFNFVSIDHAAENGKKQGRLVACPECVAAITQALKNGHDEL